MDRHTQHLSHAILLFILIMGPPPSSPLFPYTTLFRSESQTSDEPSLRIGIAHAAAPERAAQLVKMIRHLRPRDRKSTRLNSSHLGISYAVFCLKKKNEVH